MLLLNKRLQIAKTALAVIAAALYFLLQFDSKYILAFILLGGIVIDLFLLFFRYGEKHILMNDPKEVNKANLFDLVFSMACYYLVIKIFPKLEDQLSLFFWFTIFVEIVLNFWFIKKFKRINISAFGLRLFNTIVNLAFILLLFKVDYQILFGIAFIIGLAVYLDFTLIIYFLPFFQEKVHFSWQAYKVKKEYKKYLKR